MTERAEQLSLDDALDESGGFDNWDVFRQPTPRRRWHSAAELAERWRMSPEQAEEWLEALERTGSRAVRAPIGLRRRRRHGSWGSGPVADRLLRMREVADMLGVSSRTVQRWAADERRLPAPFVLSSRALRWRESEILDWLEARRGGVTHSAVAVTHSDALGVSCGSPERVS